MNLHDLIHLEQAEKRLTDQQRAFASLYLESLDAQDAYKATGYNHNKQNAYAYLHDPNLQEYIQLCLKLRAASPWEIIARLTDVARGSITDIADIDEEGQPHLNLKKAQERGMLHTIESIHYSDKGKLIIKRYSKLEALEKLAKIYRMFGDQQLRMDIRLLKVVLQAVPPESRGAVLAALERYVHDDADTPAIDPTPDTTVIDV